jgi:hypothetical protein
MKGTAPPPATSGQAEVGEGKVGCATYVTAILTIQMCDHSPDTLQIVFPFTRFTSTVFRMCAYLHEPRLEWISCLGHASI